MDKRYVGTTVIEYKKKLLTVKQVALQHRMVPETLLYRLNIKGMTVEQALKTPVTIRNNKLPSDKMTKERKELLEQLKREYNGKREER